MNTARAIAAGSSNLASIFARLRDGAADEIRAWGWLLAIAAAALVASGVVALWWVPAMHREADRLASAAESTEHRVRTIRSRPQSVAAPAPTGAVRFLSGFPGAARRQDRLAALLALAAAHRLETRGSELKLSTERQLGLLQYSVALPLAGSYTQLREFIAAAQAGDASLSLDRLRLRRASALAPLIEADLAWTFYMQPAVATLPGSIAASSPP